MWAVGDAVFMWCMMLYVMLKRNVCLHFVSYTAINMNNLKYFSWDMFALEKDAACYAVKYIYIFTS
jgi:hypothetical protein